MTTPRALLLVLVAGCAARSPAETSANTDAGDCFDATRVAGWEDAGPSRIRVRVAGRDAYELHLVGPQCVDVAWWPEIAVEPSTGSQWVCVGEGVGLGEVRFQDGPSGRTVTCRVDSVSRPG